MTISSDVVPKIVYAHASSVPDVLYPSSALWIEGKGIVKTEKGGGSDNLSITVSDTTIKVKAGGYAADGAGASRISYFIGY